MMEHDAGAEGQRCQWQWRSMAAAWLRHAAGTGPFSGVAQLVLTSAEIAEKEKACYIFKII